MNEKLITLKEITTKMLSDTKLCKQNWIQQTHIFEAQIRLNALQWIVELERRADIVVSGDPFGSYHENVNFSDFLNVINWIKHVHNITDEDIKKFKEAIK